MRSLRASTVLAASITLGLTIGLALPGSGRTDDHATPRQLTANFEMTRTIKALSDSIRSAGRLYLGGVGLLRFEMTAPSRSVLVVNGDQGWIHYPDMNVTREFELSADPVMRVLAQHMLALTSGDFYVKVEAPGGYDPYTAYQLEVTLGTLFTYPQVDLQLTDMEVVQSIQSLNNDVPLIAGKPAYARLYVKTDQATSTLGVQGWLKVLGEPQEMCPSFITASNQVSLLQQRGSTYLSLICPIPPKWIAKAGTLELTAHVQSSNIDDPDTDNNEKWVSMPVQASPPLHIQIVQIRDGCPDKGSCPESNGYAYEDYKNIHLTMQHMYPVSKVTLHPHKGLYIKWQKVYPTIRALEQLAKSKGNLHGANTVFMGLVRDSVDTKDKYRGKDFNFGGLGSYAALANWVKGINSFTAAHEVGHNMWVMHVKACGANGGAVESYPYSNTEWLSAGGERDHYGLDTGSTPPKIKPPKEYADVMTYCGPQWISDYTYKKILARLKANAGMPLLSASWNPDTEYLMITGSIQRDTDEVFLLPMMRLQGDEIDPSVWTNPDGDYVVRLLDDQEGVLFEQTFGLVEGAHDDGGAPVALVVPYDANMARLVILHDTTELASIVASPNAPTVALDPVTGTIPDTLTVYWTAADADEDELTAAVYLSTDGGETWELLTLGSDDQAEFDTSLWPRTDQGMLRVEVSDGVNAAEDVTGPFAVTAKAPVVFVIAPEDGAEVPWGLPVFFTATGYDAEDGPLSDEAYVWSSDVDGDLGTGEEIVVTELSPGWHQITVTVTDSDSNVASDTIQVYVGQRVYLPVVLKGQ